MRVLTVPIDDPGPLLALLPRPGALAWLRDGEGMVAWGRAASIDIGTGPDRFERAAAGLAGVVEQAEVSDTVGLPGTGPVLFASFTFDPAVGGSLATVPSVLVGRRDGQTWLTLAGDATDPRLTDSTPLEPHDRTRYAGASIPDLVWLDAVAKAIDKIATTSLEKVVLARDHAVWSKTPFDDRVLLQRLATRFPQCFTFANDGLIGATPELLVRREGAALTSLVLAGSAARGDDDATDAVLGKELLGSDKDRLEHALAVASVRQGLADLEAVVDPATDPFLLRLENVQHLATEVTGSSGQPPSALRAAAALHPTAAVGGTPTGAALDTITELEPMSRERYAGPVGWVDMRGDGEFGIALRCAQLSGARARLFAGAGIVRGSLPEAELEETRLKLRAMQSALDA